METVPVDEPEEIDGQLTGTPIDGKPDPMDREIDKLAPVTIVEEARSTSSIVEEAEDDTADR